MSLNLAFNDIVDSDMVLMTHCSDSTFAAEISYDCFRKGHYPGLPADGDFFFNCPCCAECHNYFTGLPEYNVPARCNIAAALFGSPNGQFYDKRRGTSCSCDEEKLITSCEDTACPTCNPDRSICALEVEYGFYLDPENGGKSKRSDI